MKKILLTSTGLQNKNFYKAFKSLLNKPIEKVIVLFIPTASARSNEEMFFVRKTQKEFIDVGIKEKNIIWFNADSKQHFNQKFDCIVVCGGNTYYLLSKLKESKYFDFIKSKVERGIPYIGISAGSVIATNDINYIKCMDDNDCDLNDFKGFSWLDGFLIPHYKENDEIKDIAVLRKMYRQKVYTISDEQAVLISDHKITIVNKDI